MEFIVHDRPCILLETLGLVYSLFDKSLNGESFGDQAYCVPVQEMETIRDLVCGDLNTDDPELQFYFKGIPVKTKTTQIITCPALNLLYNFQRFTPQSIHESIAELKCGWSGIDGYIQVSGFDAYTLQIGRSEGYTNLATEVAKLPIPPEYQLKLVEIFSRFEYHADRLEQILTPLAQKLEPLLEPWVEKTMARRAEWREYLTREGTADEILRLADLNVGEVQHVSITISYLTPLHGRGLCSGPPVQISLHMGAGFMPGYDRTAANAAPDDGEFAAMRLLTRQECVNIFRATRVSPKCIQDLSQELGMNPGTVFRNVNNMFNLGLLRLELISGRNHYMANIDKVEKINAHLLRYLKED